VTETLLVLLDFSLSALFETAFSQYMKNWFQIGINLQIGTFMLKTLFSLLSCLLWNLSDPIADQQTVL
jgi:hypothetical protein